MSHVMRFSRIISIKMFLATLLPVLIGCVYLTQNWEALTRSCEKGADHELMGIAVELAKSAEALTGAYSRFGFRHPGPAFPYWYALWESFAPFQSTPMGTHLVGQVILNLALMCVACWWFVCFVRPRALALLVPPICLIVWWGAGRTFLHDYWNPTTTIAPMLVLLLSGAALMRAHVSWCFPFAVSAVLLIHSHLSSAPLVALISVSVFLGYFLARRLTKRAKWTKREGATVAASILVAILGILPIAIDAARGPGLGNLERIAATLSSPGERTSLAAATRLVGHYFSFGASGIEIYALSFFLVCMLIGSHLLRKKEGSVLRAALMLCFIATFAAIIAASRIRGNIDPYILRSTLGLVTASTAVLMALAISMLVQRMKLSRISLRPLTITLVAVLCAAVSILVLPKPFTATAQRCGKIARPFIRALKPYNLSEVRLVIGDQAAWPFAAPLGLALLRENIRFCVDRKWQYLFDRALVCAEGTEWPRLVAYRNLPSPIPEDLTGMQRFNGPINTIFWESN